MRPDGLGIRLQCLLEAMHLAELLDAEFAVVWPDPVQGLEHHAVVPARKTFTKAFCDAHVTGRPTSGAYAEPVQPVANLDELASLAVGRKGWLVRRAHTLELLPEAQRRPAGGFRRLFDTLPFRPRLARAIAAADATLLPSSPAAVHLRAGDIVYGKHRFGARFTRKVICLPVARRLIETLVEQDRTVVLFSQDRAAADLFRTLPGVVVAADLAPRGDAVAQALFEIALMSRCAEIYAGNSVFAQIAALIGDSVLHDPRTMFTRRKQAAIIEADLFKQGRETTYPPLQTAFAAWAGAEALLKWAPARAERLLRTAIAHDPDNCCYGLKLASLLCAQQRLGDANAWVATNFIDEADGRRMRTRALGLLRKAGSRGTGSILTEDRRVLAEAAAAGPGAIRTMMADLDGPQAEPA